MHRLFHPSPVINGTWSSLRCLHRGTPSHAWSSILGSSLLHHVASPRTGQPVCLDGRNHHGDQRHQGVQENQKRTSNWYVCLYTSFHSLTFLLPTSHLSQSLSPSPPLSLPSPLPQSPSLVMYIYSLVTFLFLSFSHYLCNLLFCHLSLRPRQRSILV